LGNLAPTWLGVLYIGWLFSFAARLRWLNEAQLAAMGWPVSPEVGWLSHVRPAAWLLVLVLAVTWAADTAAYLAGRFLGRHKMAPVLSPGKTWEGTAG